MEAICVLALLLPSSQQSTLFKIPVIVISVVCLLMLLKSTIIKPSPVLVFEENNFKIRGVKPGVWKLFQLWHIEEIVNQEVQSIRLG
jgi:hypothetical protein